MLSKDHYKIHEMELIPGIDIITLLNKKDNIREMHKCVLRLQVNLEGKEVFEEEELQFVINSQMCSFDDIVDKVKSLIEKLKASINAIDSGINLLPGYQINEDSLDNDDIWVRSNLLKTLENLSWYKIRANLINIYTELINYKGDDKLQVKKFKKMIEQAEFIEQVGEYGTHI